MDQSQGIWIGVADSKYISGVNNLNDRADPLQPLNLQAGLSAAYDTDSHFFTYWPVNSNNPNWPRCNKPVLGKIRAAGGDLVTQVMVFDIDNPDHLPWENYCSVDEWLDWFHGPFIQACPWAANYSALYSTRSGVRLIFTLDHPIPVDDAENKHRWMVRALIAHGLPVDRGCSDWTRAFRLPYVRRDGQLSSTNPSMRFFASWERRIAVEQLGEITRAESDQYTQPIRDFEEPIPDRGQAEALLKEYNQSTGRYAQAKWLKAAKKKLAGRDCFDALFKQGVLAAPGQRDTTLHKYVGQVISLLFKMDGISPAHVYALFLEALDGLEPDQDTPDWFSKCWNHIGRIWVREEAKQELETQQQAEDLEAQQDLMDQLVGGMQRWCKHPALFGPKPTAQAFVHRHLIVTVGNTHHVMQRDGTYDLMSLNTSSLIARVRILGMEQVMNTRKITDHGESDIEPRTLLNESSCVVKGISARPCIEGGRIDRIDTGEAELIVPTFVRNPDIEPEFNPQVDQWLRHFFGPYYWDGCEWIAWSLAFEEGAICALSVVGDPGIGKKLLAVGLSECLKIPQLASASDMVGDYQYGLMESPFLVVNEGWPRSKWGVHPADRFRELVDGQPTRVNRKFLAPVKVYNPVRIIFTANNTSVVSMLGADRDLSPEDRDALTIRLKHFEVPKDAAHWLRSMGGYTFTGSPGNRWIEGDSGEPSDYVVAKHFLYLHSIRGERVNGRRFLVDGNTSDALMHEFRTGAGSNPLVIESIIRMLDHQSPNWKLPNQEGRLWATTSMVLDYFRTNLASTANQRLTMKQVANAFKSLCIAGGTNEPLTLNGIRARWWELDPELLLSVARRDGRKSDTLDRIVEQRRVNQQLQGSQQAYS